VIAVATSDFYADGNSSNDYIEYTQVYDSEQTNFNGIISESATIRAMFKPIRARFVKITFKDAGTAINEVQVFMAQPSEFSNTPTRKPREDPPVSFSTPVPVYNTPLPTDTALPPPTRTAVPTDPPPTDTPLPPPTKTPRPPTSTPVPTDPPTDIPPTDIPPTDVLPTNGPPTDLPTDIPFADTSQPISDLSTPVGGS
jgi:hypothetical protein